MNEPRVSVIMAAYNAATQLRECLDSLLAQEGDIPFECVIVDDASTDATPEILADYAVRRPDVIRVFRNGENRGRCYSRNRAIAEARADLVAVMDADDWAAPHRLRLQTEFMEAHPHVTVCGGGMECYETGAVWHPPLTHDDIKATLLLTAPFVHSTVMFRRGVVMPLTDGYNAEFPPTEDFELWARLARHRQVIFHNLPEPMLRYRSHPDMDRSAYKDRQATLALRVCQDLLADLGVPLDARSVRECSTPVQNILAWPNAVAFAANNSSVPLQTLHAGVPLIVLGTDNGFDLSLIGGDPGIPYAHGA